jgi:hypothetical protein
MPLRHSGLSGLSCVCNRWGCPNMHGCPAEVFHHWPGSSAQNHLGRVHLFGPCLFSLVQSLKGQSGMVMTQFSSGGSSQGT